MKTIKILSFFIAGLFLVQACKTEKTALELNLKEGKTYTMKTTVKQNMTQTIQGNTQEIQTDITAVIDYEVTGRNGDTMSIDLTYSKMNLSMQSPFINMSINSDQPQEGNVMYDIISKLIGKKISMKVLSNGEVVYMSDFGEIMDDILDQMPVPEGYNKDQMKQQFNRSFGEGSIAGNFKLMFDYLPEKPVKVGGSWETTTETDFMINGLYESEWKLTEIKDQMAVIEGETDITAERTAVETGMQQFPVEMEMTGTQNTLLNVDKSTGWIESGEANIKMNMTLFTSNPQMGEMEIPMSIDMSVHYSTTE